ncbi:SDR family oxidoreductase [Salinispirillum sp. LH 10-3-1]|uniref:SDR family oxidoreductase n=1 Tax=Salinispirillum sp. LH 10-3-1 TaxID=2952525 RepID=A0AB38YHW2_9GAMM
MATLKVLITGAAGYIGHLVGNELQAQCEVVGIDIRGNDAAHFPIHHMDINSPELANWFAAQQFTHVVHLASVLDASPNRQRDFQIDVCGTENVLRASLASGVQHITVTSSGAAYGYHPDNAAWLSESDPLRGNEEFAYSWHKRLVEEMLADYRQKHPQLKQLVLRPGTVLGSHTRNLITRLFMKNRILTIRHCASPFVFIWDEDVVRIIKRGVSDSKTGIYNLAGDDALTLQEIALRLGKPTLNVPAWLLQALLWLGWRLRMTRYGPEQLKFLRYRPVLSNDALKRDFGYVPQKTSAEVFQLFCDHIQEQ